MALLSACDMEPNKTDAELGLNPVQARGRRVFDRQCAMCHTAYITRNRKGPSLMGMYKKKYLENGMPANDERVRDIIWNGRAKMPAFNRAITPEQLDELMEYLHTL